MGYNIAVILTNDTDQRGRVMMKLIQAVLPTARCTTFNYKRLLSNYWQLKPGTKETYQIGPGGREAFMAHWEKLMTKSFPFKYDAVVCFDVAMAHHLLPEKDARTLKDTDALAGMLINDDRTHGVPLLFVMDPLHTYGRMYDDEYKASRGHMTAWHLMKLKNVLEGRVPEDRPVKFFLPKSVPELRQCERLLAKAHLIATDIETSHGLISVKGFAAHVPGLDYTPVVIIPLLINMPNDHEYWATDELLGEALDSIRRILANPVPKCYHNGSYDLSKLFQYGIPVTNFIWDTMHMLHAMWPTVPKALYIGASMFIHHYRYWKDDGKDVGEDGKTKWQVPNTVDKTLNYWAYNGLDCVNTLELCLGILRLWYGEAGEQYPKFLPGYEYVWKNYIREYALQFGPCFYMSFHGLHAAPERQAALRNKLTRESAAAQERLQVLIGDPDFNPNAPAQVANLLYDVLDLKPLARKGRTTDKRVVQTFADMHPIYADVIKSIQDVKEPRNNISKYGNMYMHGERYLYNIKAGATTTTRQSSSEHNFGYGSNAQNMPKTMRVMLGADDGEYLCSIDYSQSDSYFVAFESQDETMIETVTDDRDTHSVHVEFFFGHKYEAVVAGAKKKEPWVVDPVTGVRQIIKKVSHGTNYDMQGGTMLMNIRRDAAISMVNAILGSPNARLFMKFMGLDQAKDPTTYVGMATLWSNEQLERACDFAQKLYYIRYKRLKQWKTLAVAEASRAHGLIEIFGGHKTLMLCDPAKNPRFVPAAKGQGGTAGNINNAMLRLYFLNQSMWDCGFRMVLQVHDELVTAIPRNVSGMHLADQQIKIMETPCTIHGRTFVVPVEAELSLSWGAAATVVYKGLDKSTFADYDNAIIAKEQALIKSLGVPDVFAIA